jgi:hypothetical protein
MPPRESSIRSFGDSSSREHRKNKRFVGQLQWHKGQQGQQLLPSLVHDGAVVPDGDSAPRRPKLRMPPEELLIHWPGKYGERSGQICVRFGKREQLSPMCVMTTSASAVTKWIDRSQDRIAIESWWSLGKHQMKLLSKASV